MQPLLAKLSGDTAPVQPLRFRARAAERLKKSPGRLDFQRGVVSRGEDGTLEVRSTGHQGSHIFSSFQPGATAFVVLEGANAVTLKRVNGWMWRCSIISSEADNGRRTQ